MLKFYLIVCLHILVLFSQYSHSTMHSNHLGVNYHDFDAENDETEQEDPDMKDDLLDQDIEEMMSNSLNNDYDRGCPGLDYLGVGYDSIYANSLGSEASSLDPGYRAPVIEFTWRKNSEGYSPTLGSLHPLGGWVRPVFSCSRSTKIDEINNMEQFKNSLSASTKLNGDIPQNSFTGSVEYKNTFSNFKSKRQKIYNKTEQCIRYQVGIPLNLNWKRTESFESIASKLPKLVPDEIKHCNIRGKMKKSDEKCDSIKPWIKFFDMFGTHFTNQLTLGGKITQTIRFDVSTLEKLQRQGIDIDFEIRSELGSGGGGLSVDMNNNKSKLEDLGYKKMLVLGGQMPNFPLKDEEFAHWGRSVADNPMPIGVVATSLKTLITPSLHSSYDEALHQFAILNGINYEQLKSISGNLTEFSKEMEKSSLIALWTKENRVKCPTGSNVLLGFSLIFDDTRLLGVNSCKSQTSECRIPATDNAKYSFICFACSFGLQPDVKQVVVISKDTDDFVEMKCPNHTMIQIGAIFITNEEGLFYIKECEYGRTTCKYDLKEKETAYIWAACYYYLEKLNKMELKFSLYKDSPDKSFSCPERYKIIKGYVAYLPANDQETFEDPEPCESYAPSCSFKPDKNKLAFILCKYSEV